MQFDPARHQEHQGDVYFSDQLEFTQKVSVTNIDFPIFLCVLVVLSTAGFRII